MPTPTPLTERQLKTLQAEEYGRMYVSDTLARKLVGLGYATVKDRVESQRYHSRRLGRPVTRYENLVVFTPTGLAAIRRTRTNGASTMRTNAEIREILEDAGIEDFRVGTLRDGFHTQVVTISYGSDKARVNRTLGKRLSWLSHKRDRQGSTYEWQARIPTSTRSRTNSALSNAQIKMLKLARRFSRQGYSFETIYRRPRTGGRSRFFGLGEKRTAEGLERRQLATVDYVSTPGPGGLYTVKITKAGRDALENHG